MDHTIEREKHAFNSSAFYKDLLLKVNISYNDFNVNINP